MTYATMLRASITPLLVVLTVSTGCSQEARKARHLERGDKYFSEEQYREALIEYRNVLRIEDDDEHAIRRVGVALYRLGHLGQAFRYLQKSQEQDPENLEVRLKLASIYFLGSQPEEAREEASFVLEKEPKNLEALMIMADTATSPEQVDAAFESLEALRADYEDQARFHLTVGKLHIKKRDVESAELAFKEAAAQEPDSVVAHWALGNHYAAKRDFEAAESEFKNAAAIAPVGSQAKIRLADFYLFVRRPDEAKRVLREFTDEAPDYLPAWRRLAQISFSQDEFDESAEALDVLLEKSPRDPDGLLLRGRVHLAKNETNEANKSFREATRVLQQLVERRPNLGSARFKLAQAHVQLGEIEQAKTELEHLKSLFPSSAEVIVLLAELNLRTGDAASAAEDLTALVAEQPSARAYQLLGSARRRNQDGRGAFEAYRQWVRLAPEDPRARYFLGVSLRALGKRTEAKRQLEASLSLSPGYVEPLTQLAALDFAEGRRNAAIERVKKQIALVPESGRHHYLLGELYRGRPDTAQAEAAYLKAIELEPSMIGAYARLAGLYVASEREEEALAKTEDALAANPNSVPAHTLMAVLHHQKGELSKAQGAYERALELSPGFAPAANNLAYLYANQEGRLDEALALAETAREAAPANPHIADTLGWILYKRGTYERALGLLRESAEELPENAEVQFHLGMTNYRLDNKEAAWQLLNHALELNSSFAGAEEARRVLATLAELQ